MLAMKLVRKPSNLGSSINRPCIRWARGEIQLVMKVSDLLQHERILYRGRCTMHVQWDADDSCLAAFLKADAIPVLHCQLVIKDL